AEWLAPRGHVYLMSVDVAHRVDEGRLFEVRVLKRERAFPVHLRVGVVVDRRAVGERARDVDLAARDRQLQRLRRTAHREGESAALDEEPDVLGDIFLERGNVREAKAARRGAVLLHE